MQQESRRSNPDRSGGVTRPASRPLPLTCSSERGWSNLVADERDRRNRSIALTEAGRAKVAPHPKLFFEILV
jgi:hypothetical protein